jgi:hypothetical protein
METPFETRVSILADLWLNYRMDEEFKDFIEYNDMGLPMAYFIENQLVEPKPISIQFVNETFELLLAGLEVEDTGFADLNDLLDS